jgi:outer membrane protein assembly factor BamB
MAVVGGVVYTMGAIGDDEFVIAIDAKGEKLWSQKIGPVHDFKGNQWSRGPNATPTVDGENVYCMGSKGDLLCCKKDGGKKVWSKSLPNDLGGDLVSTGGGFPKYGWGYSTSPVVDGDKLVLTPGGAKGLFAALNKKTGATLWRSKDVTDLALYVTPTVATIGGVKQYITMTQPGLTSVSAETGELLWRWEAETPLPDVLCPSPIVKGDLVYATYSGDGGGGSVLLKIEAKNKKFSPTAVHTERIIANRQGGVVLVGDHLYGYHEDRGLVCQEFAKGKLVWQGKARTAIKVGSIVAGDGKLFALAEDGNVAMIEASPKAYKLLGSSFALPEKAKKVKPSAKVWTHPSLSDGKLYLRDQELVFCYEVK